MNSIMGPEYEEVKQKVDGRNVEGAIGRKSYPRRNERANERTNVRARIELEFRKH